MSLAEFRTTYPPPPSPRLILPQDLRAKGIPLSPVQIWRLRKAGKFPNPIQVSPGRIAYVESEIDAYVASRIAERDGGTR